MQLECYLDGMRFCTNGIDKTHVICNDISIYSKIAESFEWRNQIHWIDESNLGNFGTTFGELICNLDPNDLVLCSVDDFVWFRPFNLKIAQILLLEEFQDVIGLSLRLGINVAGFQPSLE
jgi:hypothetical protein